MKLPVLALALAAALIGLAIPASAATVGVTYSGVVTDVDPAGAGQFSAGDTFSFNLFVNDAAADQESMTGIGVYFGITQFNGTFSNGYAFASTSGADNLLVFAGPGGSEVDFNPQNLSAPAVGGYGLENVLLTFRDPSGAMLPGEGIPTDLASLLSLSQSNNVTLLFLSASASFRVYGTVTAAAAAVGATPIPGALPLFASALGGLGFFGWKRRRAA
jgi:hypothetical protein